LLRDAIAHEKPEKGFKMEFGVSKAADGTEIHRLSGPFKEDDPKEASMVKAFGKEASLAFAFREGSILSVFGEESTGQVKMALDRLAPSRPADGSNVPIAAVVRVADLDAFFDKEEERDKFRRAAEGAFAGDAAKKDRLSLAVKGEGDGL